MSADAFSGGTRQKMEDAYLFGMGIVFTTNSHDKRFTLQTVGRRTEISELDEWRERTPRTQIVAIGESGGIDAQELSRKFDACIEQLSTKEVGSTFGEPPIRLGTPNPYVSSK